MVTRSNKMMPMAPMELRLQHHTTATARASPSSSTPLVRVQLHQSSTHPPAMSYHHPVLLHAECPSAPRTFSTTSSSRRSLPMWRPSGRCSTPTFCGKSSSRLRGQRATIHTSTSPSLLGACSVAQRASKRGDRARLCRLTGFRRRRSLRLYRQRNHRQSWAAMTKTMIACWSSRLCFAALAAPGAATLPMAAGSACRPSSRRTAGWPSGSSSDGARTATTHPLSTFTTN